MFRKLNKSISSGELAVTKTPSNSMAGCPNYQTEKRPFSGVIDTGFESAENYHMTATFELELPDSLQLSEFDIKMILAAKLYEMGTLSGGQAAELAGVSKRTFLELLGKYGVSIFGYSAEELEEDLVRLRK
jgi:predicted HTH domain antitoxin